MAIADLVKTTSGPKGMDKILQSTGRGREVTVTNDGATILISLHIDNPAAKVLVEISKVQDDEVDDGTTSVIVLAGELLREAEKLVNAKIHPMTIISGYRMVAECACDVLLQRAMDNKDDAEKFTSDLMKIAKTTLSSIILSQDKEQFAQLAVDAVMRLKGSTNLDQGNANLSRLVQSLSQKSVISGSMVQGSSIIKRLFNQPLPCTPNKSSVPKTLPQGISSPTGKCASSIEVSSNGGCSNSTTPQEATPTHCTCLLEIALLRLLKWKARWRSLVDSAIGLARDVAVEGRRNGKVEEMERVKRG
ncbi:T-complex protein 1 subunit beta-like [Rhodamnia argentea]|uniref:T-complex protein 1 subunit beta-like n=1 Tax=Rhodamnia argentea TaxID=178133 RepID=A0ABM3H4M4_9MYRT|nr:T-complex protein 1 subunit beta-like [Rhodamnia argentea]